jgi:hypothetical protein
LFFDQCWFFQARVSLSGLFTIVIRWSELRLSSLCSFVRISDPSIDMGQFTQAWLLPIPYFDQCNTRNLEKNLGAISYGIGLLRVL